DALLELTPPDQGAREDSAAYSQLILEQLERANLFLVPLDHEQRWYRYHHLFAEVLRERLRSRAGRAARATLHRRASAWFDRHGLASEAIHHAFSAADAQGAAELIERHADAILKRGEYLTLHAWLARLPGEVLHTRPQLALLRAWTFTFTNDLEAAEQC